MYQAKVLEDSINTATGDRLTTLEITYPRFVHSELMTHRVFSRNSASSRAIPISKMIERVMTDPVLPVYWGRNQSGMKAREELGEVERARASAKWIVARNYAVRWAMELSEIGVHKQIVNRLLEPWMWITVIVSATEWENFFNLRCHPDAQPEIRRIAEMMREEMRASRPYPTNVSTYCHLPLMLDRGELLWQGYSMDDLCKISIGRCARVSYLTHDGKREPEKDIELCNSLAASGHMSPFEHVASPAAGRHGNFQGWMQYRKLIEGEEVFRG